ncbi:hypothetical protein CYG49_03420 [Candidatus Saccharibacteria bacterium]|nr:MAG: hypothetical protein CYG49_03420 [Candidatus Saccharibacteria bacterium]
MQFDPSFFRGNRKALSALLPESLIILSAHVELQRSRDVPYPFEQESNFWYLTGINEPGWRLVIDGRAGKEYLVAPVVRETRELWDGVLSPERVTAISGIEHIMTKNEWSELSRQLQQQHQRVYALLPQTQLKEYFDFELNPAPEMLVNELKELFSEVLDCRPELSKLRGIKQPVEIAAIQRAIDITIDGIKVALANLPQYQHEFDFEAELSKQFRIRGAQEHAFTPIIAGGKNAYTVHYIANNDRLNRDEWLLFDVGARYGRYCADLARAIPPKEPTKHQMDIYNAVLKVHDFAASLLKPGKSVEEYFNETEDAMGNELVKLGLIEGKTREEIRAFFPNAIGHGLGIDIHDPLGKIETFEAGMVMTVEPSIHIAKQQLGMRLESVILITEDGPHNMSANLPTDLEAITRLVGLKR